MPLSDSQKIAALEITGDPTDSGSSSTARFEMRAAENGWRVQKSLDDNDLFRNFGRLINSVVTGLVNDDESPNKRITIDAGLKEHAIVVEFDQWAEAEDYGGNPLQWGDDPNSGLTDTSATGEHPITKMDIFFNWVRKTRIDSRNNAGGGPAIFEFGEHHPSGQLEPLEVILGDVDAVVTDANSVSFTIPMIEAAALGNILDGSEDKG